jgi:hypothetical protein
MLRTSLRRDAGALFAAMPSAASGFAAIASTAARAGGKVGCVEIAQGMQL